MLDTILMGILKVVGAVLLVTWAVGLGFCVVAVIIMMESKLKGED